MKVYKQERMVNHVPNKLKKRVLKKKGIPYGHYESSIQYYQTLKIVKGLDIEAYHYLLNRMRVYGILKQKEDHSFTGRLIADISWGSSPQGGVYWARLDSRVLQHQYDNAYHKKHSKV